MTGISKWLSILVSSIICFDWEIRYKKLMTTFVVVVCHGFIDFDHCPHFNTRFMDGKTT